jgi:hypothetical protein
MTSYLLATYANGVFTPETPVDLPENQKVELTLHPLNGVEPPEPRPGSAEAWEAYLGHVEKLQFRSGEPRPSRDELYEGR